MIEKADLGNLKSYVWFIRYMKPTGTEAQLATPIGDGKFIENTLSRMKNMKLELLEARKMIEVDEIESKDQGNLILTFTKDPDGIRNLRDRVVLKKETKPSAPVEEIAFRTDIEDKAVRSSYLKAIGLAGIPLSFFLMCISIAVPDDFAFWFLNVGWILLGISALTIFTTA